MDSHVTYEDFRGQEKTMPVRKMAETLADQNLNPPFDKDQDGRLRSKLMRGAGALMNWRVMSSGTRTWLARPTKS